LELPGKTGFTVSSKGKNWIYRKEKVRIYGFSKNIKKNRIYRKKKNWIYHFSKKYTKKDWICGFSA
jgi:hypothetical protein